MNSASGSLKSHLQRSGAPITPTVTRPAGEADDEEYVPFANGRIGNRTQLAVAFRKADGSVKAFSYAHFYSVEADDPAEGFVVVFSHSKVRVTGRKLDELFHSLCRHKAAEIVEAQQHLFFENDEQNPMIERIEFV